MRNINGWRRSISIFEKTSDYYYLHKLLSVIACLKEGKPILRCLGIHFNEGYHPLLYKSENAFLSQIFMQLQKKLLSKILLQSYLLLILLYRRTPTRVLQILEKMFDHILTDIAINFEILSYAKSFRIKFYIVTIVLFTISNIVLKVFSISEKEYFLYVLQRNSLLFILSVTNLHLLVGLLLIHILGISISYIYIIYNPLLRANKTILLRDVLVLISTIVIINTLIWLIL